MIALVENARDFTACLKSRWEMCQNDFAQSNHKISCRGLNLLHLVSKQYRLHGRGIGVGFLISCSLQATIVAAVVLYCFIP